MRFLIDDEYYKEFPVAEEADIAAKELEADGTITLGKGKDDVLV